MDVGSVLRVLGIGRVVLALGGRYRAALWLSLAVAVGWFLVGCAPAAHAGGPVALGPDYRPNLAGALPLGVTLAVGAALWLGIIGAATWGVVHHFGALDRVADHGGVRYPGVAVRDGAGERVNESAPGWLRPAGGPFFRRRRDLDGS